MSSPLPIAIATDNKFAFLGTPGVAGGEPEIMSIWGKDEVRFRSFLGAPWMLPPADRLEPVVTVNRMGVDERPHDIEARHALGADLNNLGVLYVLGGRLSEAWETFQEADVQFIEIANSFPYPPTPALLARAVTLYNRNVIDLIDGHFEADMIDAATKCLELVRPSDRDSGFGFVASAVGFDSYPDSIGD